MGRKAKILMIDDSKLDQVAVKRVIDKLYDDKIGCTFRQGIDDAIEELCSGTSGVETLPDLILLDLNLDDGNGLEFIVELKKHPQARAVPVVIFSSSTDINDIRTAYDRGASSYWSKPCNPRDLEVGLRKLCEYWFSKPNLLPLGCSFFD
ncbi:MAG: response regulator [Myxococcales bacterium]|nr:MAG: response regulator [Myxococcales bacterium]